MHPKQASLLNQAQNLNDKLAATRTAATVLWKYVDEDGKEYYLPEKLTRTRSPYTGKSVSAKPTRMSMSDVAGELKEDAKDEK